MSAKNSPLKLSWIYLEAQRGYTLSKIGVTNGVANDQKPFISQGGVLTAQAMIANSKDSDMPTNVKFGITYLHPSTMELCKIRLGGPIALLSCSSRRKAAFRAWPSISAPLGKFLLSESSCKLLGIEDNDFATIASALPQNTIATEVEISLDQTNRIFLKTPYLKEYLQHSLNNKYFIQKQTMYVEYYGRNICISLSCKDFLGGTFAGSSVLLENDTEQKFSALSIANCTETVANGDGKDELGAVKQIPVFEIAESTKISLVSNESDFETEKEEWLVSYADIGGLRKQIEELKMLVELPLQKPELFKKSGLLPPSGILLHGPPGTGKSMLMNACVKESGVKSFSVSLASLTGEAEQNISAIFEQAKDRAPSVIVIDEIDRICPKKDKLKPGAGKHELSLVMNNILSFNKQSSKYVIVLAATNAIDAVDPSLRRVGLLESEIEVSIPSPSERVEIFRQVLKQFNNSLNSKDIEDIAEDAHGYVGADIAAVCAESGRRSLQRWMNEDYNGKNPKIVLNRSDIKHGLKKIPPSAIRELVVRVPKVLWSDIGGNNDIKKKLKQIVEWPLKHPDAFHRLGIDPPSGVLLYGPPGCSKTLTAKALATESGLNFISIKGPELFSKYVGDSEKAIRMIFSKARSASPSIIFIDEIDALATERGGKVSGSGNVSDRVLATLLTEMDGVEQGRDVIVVAATNRPDKIDKALLRPGRIDRIVHVPLPDSDTRRDIFRIQFQKTPICSSLDVEWLVQETDMYSGAEICAVCREAALAALERDMESSEVTEHDFKIALAAVLPQTTKEIADMHLEYSRTLQSQIKT